MQEDNPRHILVLEDEPATRLLICEMLSAAGYRVTETKTGSEALTQVRQVRPDLVLTDLGVPGLDGYQFIKMLTLGNIHQGPIVVLSGRTTEEDVERALEAGAHRFVPKPIDRQLLLRAITESLAAAPGSGS